MEKELIANCIDFINTEIEAFDRDLLQLRNRLHLTQNVIKSFYSNNYDEQMGEEVRKSLVENKNIILQLKREADAYAQFEKLNLHLTGHLKYDSEELNNIITYLISYFEKKEAYENCALFQKLQLKFANNN